MAGRLQATTLRNFQAIRDLENVFSLHKTNVSSAFYKRKLSVYNLTAINIRTKKAYCALWCETTSGRAGNDIASGLIRISSEAIKDGTTPESDIHITLWSDSCVPLNRNSLMAAALMRLRVDYPQVKSVTQKFQEPGHSSVQEIDNLHSVLETRKFSVLSPLCDYS